MSALEVGDELSEGKLDIVIATRFANANEGLLGTGQRVFEVEENITDLAQCRLMCNFSG